MIYGYKVKHNGILYNAGEDVKVESQEKETQPIEHKESVMENNEVKTEEVSRKRGRPKRN